MERWDAIVVGGGAMGTAAAWHLARRGRSCLLLERFAVGHRRGSSHGPTRIFRLSYDHPDYVRMARESRERWRELEEAAGESLLLPTGGLDTGPGARTAADALAEAGEGFEWLPARGVAERWPALRLEPGTEALFQPDAGVCLAERTVRAQARVAAAAGAAVREGTAAEAVVPAEDGVEVRAGGEVHRAPVAVLAVGAWAGPMLRACGLSLPLVVTQEQVVYFDEPSGGPLPSLIGWTDPPDPPTYLVPDPVRPGAFKVAEHHAGPEVTADERTFDVDPDRRARVEAWVRGRLPAARPTGEADTCLYANTPDEDFVIDRIGPLVVAAGFSGHGFKFTPLIGEALADLATGTEPSLPLPRFSASRF